MRARVVNSHLFRSSVSSSGDIPQLLEGVASSRAARTVSSILRNSSPAATAFAFHAALSNESACVESEWMPSVGSKNGKDMSVVYLRLLPFCDESAYTTVASEPVTLADASSRSLSVGRCSNVPPVPTTLYTCMRIQSDAALYDKVRKIACVYPLQWSVCFISKHFAPGCNPFMVFAIVARWILWNEETLPLPIKDSYDGLTWC